LTYLNQFMKNTFHPNKLKFNLLSSDQIFMIFNQLNVFKTVFTKILLIFSI